MKRFSKRSKNFGYFLYRIVSPIFDPIKFVRGLKGYFWFIKDWIKYNFKAQNKIRLNTNLFPSLHDKTSFTSFDAHYFYQQLWTFEKVLNNKPDKHVDVGSTYEMSGYLSKIVPTTFVDIRPIKVNLENLSAKDASILNLPYEDDFLDSLFCLHVVEHIGLGRYGDPIDPDGMKKACEELSRVLKPGGKLYFSTPVGKDRMCFNSHRITDPVKVLSIFDNLMLEEFNVVTDLGDFKQDVNPDDYKNQDYACGIYQFTK